MKLKLMTILAAAALLLTAGSAMSQSALSMDSTTGITGGQMDVGVEATFYIRWTTGSQPPDINILGASNGFRVYSEDGATWGAGLTHVPYWDLDVCFCIVPFFPGWDAAPYFNDNIFINPFSINGSGADTIGLGGNSKFPSPGIAAGFSEFVYAISVTPDVGSEGKTICIDSSWYPPGGEWIWSSDTGVFGEIKPSWNGPFCYTVASGSAVSDRDDGLPTSFALSQNYPNPFNPSTEINFDVPTRSHVNLSVFNVLGQKVNTLVNEELAPGPYSADWNGTASDGSSVASGIYFYRMEAGSFVQTKKMMLLK